VKSTNPEKGVRTFSPPGLVGNARWRKTRVFPVSAESAQNGLFWSKMGHFWVKKGSKRGVFGDFGVIFDIPRKRYTLFSIYSSISRVVMWTTTFGFYGKWPFSQKRQKRILAKKGDF